MSIPQSSRAKDKETIRLFFALWPSDSVRARIQKNQTTAAELHNGRCLRRGNFHLTLVFLGTIPADYLTCLQTMASDVQSQRFNLKLDHVGLFAKPKCLWLGCHEKPESLMLLAELLAQGVKSCGLSIDERQYNPHLTIMRKVTELTEFTVEPIDWSVTEFCLVKSEPVSDGVEYSVVQAWPLLPNDA